MNEIRPKRTPFWRIRTFEKWDGKWRKSSFAFNRWHWIQDIVYVGKRTKEIAMNEAIDRIELWMSRFYNYPNHDTLMIQLRYIEEE